MTHERSSLVILSLVISLLAISGEAQDPSQPTIDKPLPAAEAARTMLVPDGFQVTLFAGEPHVQQPIGFCIDDRGRLWVAEAYNYPRHGTSPGDRILILEDSDGDGQFDRRTVFYDKLNYVTGIEFGFGGAWVMSPPSLYFIPDRDGDDRPDGPPEVILDGFGNHSNSHNLANGFSWGPDGWLYGTHGRTNWSLIGKPGTPAKDRVRFDGGVYRFHPVRKVWEAYADGTTNPWGIDWNDMGEAFVCNCVNPHLFHVIPGAHYEPWRNRESSQYAYERIPTIADHLHFVGQTNVRDGLGSSAEDAAGGGHAHCGTMIYLGDNWPERFRNSLFTNNIHGRRINNDVLTRHGSGYSASHGKDLMRSRDPWYMGVTLRYGPDGAVYASDWSDTGECHSVTNTRRETGRIYKISYGQPAPRLGDLATLKDDDLATLQLERNDWHVQHARRLLQERAAAGRDLSSVRVRLLKQFHEHQDVSRKLRALWALHVIGSTDSEFLIEQLSHPDEYVRAWAIRLLCVDSAPPPAALLRFQHIAATPDSSLARLHLASVLQRLEPTARWPIAEALMQHEEDAKDHNLPLMIWYGIEPLVNVDLARFVLLVQATRIPLIARHIGRRVASIPEAKLGLDSLVESLAGLAMPLQLDLLHGLQEGLEGRRTVPMPKSWERSFSILSMSKEPLIREQALRLALVFNDPRAMESLRQVARDTSAPPEARLRSLQSLISKKGPGVSDLLLEMINDQVTRRLAIRGLAEFDHPQTASRLLEKDVLGHSGCRQDAILTLASRVTWATRLMDALEAGLISRSDLSAYTARQIANLNDASLRSRINKFWGELRTTPAEKVATITELKKKLSPDSLAQSNRSKGRVLFQRTCANCHRLFDAGGNIGPDITGAQRTNLDYLLQTLIDPNAAVSKDYQMQIIETTTGRIITGLIVNETKTAVTVQTVNEKVVVPVVEIEERKRSPYSIMPEGLLQNLSTSEVRSLLAYLMGPGQVPLPE